jgi:hypothetical protein
MSLLIEKQIGQIQRRHSIGACGIQQHPILFFHLDGGVLRRIIGPG